MAPAPLASGLSDDKSWKEFFVEREFRSKTFMGRGQIGSLTRIPKQVISCNMDPVHSLAFEFPWLVSASGDGKLSLIDVRKLLKSKNHASGTSASCVKQEDWSSVEPPQRMLHGFAKILLSVDIGADRIVCVGEEGVVRIWNFTQALKIE